MDEMLEPAGLPGDLSENDDILVDRIALPHQLPPPARTQLVSRFQKQPNSSTVDTLLQQNEDLMARLSIQIRRSSDFEIRIHSLEERLQSMTSRQQGLSDENQFLKEKSRRLESQLLVQKELQAQLQESKSQLSDAQIQVDQLQILLSARDKKLNESYTESQERSQALVEARNQLELQSHRSQLLQDQVNKYEIDLRIQSEHFREDLSSLIEQAEMKERRLTDEFHKALSQLDQAKRDFENSKARIDHMSEEKIVLENRALLAERRRDEIEKKFQSEIERIQTDAIRARADAQTKGIQIENLSQALSQADLRSSKFEADSVRYQEQLSALHILYEHTTHELNQLTQKIEAGTKLNQQLSEALVSQKKELELIRSEHQQCGLKNAEVEPPKQEVQDLLKRVVEQMSQLDEIV